METTMTTHMRMLSSLALTAATLVALSNDALAKMGGFSGMSGMRSYSVVRTTPMVVTRVRTTSTAAVYKQTSSAVKSSAKLSASSATTQKHTSQNSRVQTSK